MLGPRSRREFLAVPARGLAAALLAGRPLASQDDQLLDDLSRRCFLYFWEQSDPHSGITRDRARADGGFLPSLSELQSVDVPETSQTDKFRLSPGDVLISARGSIKVAGVLQAQEGAIAGANLIVVRPGKTLAGPLVLAFLRHPTTQAKLERLSAGTTVASLNVSAVAALQVNVPPSEKQAKLAKLVQLADEHHVAARRAAELRLKLAQEAAMRALTA